MKKIFFILFIFSTFKLYAQNYDLIVTSKGDSIACFIDSITDSKIYFEMKYNDKWIHTNTSKTEYIEYKTNAIDKKLVIFKPGTSNIARIKKPIDYSDKSNYGCRYLFAPSAFGMKKGTKSYTNYDLFVEDFQFSITDRLSIYTGTSVFLNPVYVIPTYTFKINDKSSFAVGDLFLFTTYGDFLYGNLFYGLYTRGNLDNNFTIGAGLWTSQLGKNETETIDQDPDPSFISYKVKIPTTSPAFNFSAQFKLSKNTYFVTENYWFKINMDAIADLKGPNPSGAWYDITIRSEHYAKEETVLAGILGLRIINKKNPSKSWQISSIYVLAHNGDIPDKYQQPDWDTYDTKEGGYSFFPIPLISFTKKF